MVNVPTLNLVGGFENILAEFDLYPRFNQQVSGVGSGEVYKSSLGPTLWEGHFKFQPLDQQQAYEYDTVLHLLEYSGARIITRDFRRDGPKNDPNGTTISGSTLVIDSFNLSANEITISGFPAGYVLVPGDAIGFTYGTSPTRYAYHLTPFGGTADGTGVMSGLTVSPSLVSGVQAGDPVSVYKPELKTVAIPGSFEYGKTEGQIRRGMGFRFVQSHK